MKNSQISDVGRGESYVLVYGERLREEVGEVGLTGDKADVKLPLADTTPDPTESHIDRLRFFGPNGAVGETNGTFVVTEYRCGGLGVAEIGENMPLVYTKLCVGVGGGILCL